MINYNYIYIYIYQLHPHHQCEAELRGHNLPLHSYRDIHVDTLNGVPFWMKPTLVLSCFWGVLPGF